jgi:hypothetical protein
MRVVRTIAEEGYVSVLTVRELTNVLMLNLR